ncbi:hypothetical protein ACNOYE_06850 [Nannocystaceae bacterium ST9]
MAADPRDDFSVFADVEHMFFGLTDPFALIRDEITESLTRQVASTRVESIRCAGEPKFLTLGRRRDDEPDTLIVTYFACCFRCSIEVATAADRERLDATVTLCFGEVDRPGHERMRSFLDVHADAERAFEDAEFQLRFLGFRNE